MKLASISFTWRGEAATADLDGDTFRWTCADPWLEDALNALCFPSPYRSPASGRPGLDQLALARHAIGARVTYLAADHDVVARQRAY